MPSEYAHLSRDQLVSLVEASRADRSEVERFRNLVDQAADGIFVLDEAGVLVEVNDAGATMLGMTRQEAVGRPIGDHVAPMELPNVAEALAQLRTGKPLVFERTMRRKDGSVFPAEVSAKRLSDGRIQGILRDITIRQRAQENLRRSEERFRNLTAAAFEGIVISDRGGIVDVNDQFARMYHCIREDLIGCEVVSLVAPESRALVAERIKSGFEEPYEHRAIRKDGSVFDVEVSAKIVDWGGRRVRVTAVRDITDRKRAEAALRESEQRLSLIFQNTFDPLALYGVDAGGGYRMLAVNPAFLRAASQRAGKTITEDLIIGRSFDELVRDVLEIDEQAAAESKRGLDQAVATGQVIRWDDTQTRPSGKFSSERTDIPIFDGHGCCRLVLRVVHDMTERVRAEQERTALLERTRRQAEAIVRYAIDPAVTAGDVPQAARKMTEMAANALEVERASVWLLEADKRTAHCVDRYERSFRRHSPPMVPIDLARYPEILANIVEGRAIAVEDIDRDPRTQRLGDELAAAGFYRGGKASALTTGVRVRGEVIGVVWTATVGDIKQWQPDEIAFCGALGDQFAQAVLNAEREQAARDLRSLAGQIMTTEDEERRRIARDLHDSTGQLLAALEINMVTLSRAAAGLDAKAQALLQDCMDQAHLCSTSIRTASYLLHPPLLDEMGLVSAIQWHLDGFCRRSGIKISADLPPDCPRMPAEDELSLFRVVQEALTNIHRHSGAKSGRISLRRAAAEVVLTVADDGHGIAPESLTHFREGRSNLGVGLAGMRERLRQLGGRLEIQSDGTGTRVEAVLPSRPAHAADPSSPVRSEP
ncbi:MAG TPA: PAS domain S-box protein [Opitutaceae bacterium]|nr:PAS domain S-box protein [Opitutaceae bacterium]